MKRLLYNIILLLNMVGCPQRYKRDGVSDLIVHLILPTVSFLAGIYLLFTMVRPIPRHPQPLPAVIGANVAPMLRKKYPMRISVIIPARNEEENLRTNLPLWMSAHELDPNLIAEIIVVDDSSTDRTAFIAMAAGAKVHSLRHSPRAWYGKTWALISGATRAKGDWLLFADADVYIEPGHLLQWLRNLPPTAAYYTVQPSHKHQESFEQLTLLANASTVLMMSKGALPPRQSGGFGPFSLTPKEVYFHVGSHLLVRSEILEQYRFAQKMSFYVPVINLLGGNTIFQNIHKNLNELWTSWVKTLAASALAEGNRWRSFLIVLWIMGLLSFWPIWLNSQQPTKSHFIAFSIAYFAEAALLLALLRRSGSFSVISASLFPISSLLLVIMFLHSVWKIMIVKQVEWKGKVWNIKRQENIKT
ncbi:Glycosyl transferase family 2 [Alicyclobacillus tolerans]|uniref:4,4'-diaponeurosporenoate glycosyltransferase n=1 Tax=Alicyclobacillus tolerans TaxID=90970 RepID=A0A1M6V6U5_9BACL|nr:Glycosyl transferase family 2 [Alicyclobacillus montanus]